MNDLPPVHARATGHFSSDIDSTHLDSHTAQRLKDASPEHLHATTRRFFIGPIPEGWLNSNRKSWYKRSLEFADWARNTADYDAAAFARTRRSTSISADPSLVARLHLSFPQPSGIATFDADGLNDESVEEEESQQEEPQTLAPVATSDALRNTNSGVEDDAAVVADWRDLDLRPTSPARSRPLTGGNESFETAHEHRPISVLTPKAQDGLASELDLVTDRPVSSTLNRDSLLAPTSTTDAADIADNSSRTALLAAEGPQIAAGTSRSASISSQHDSPKRINGQQKKGSMVAYDPLPAGGNGSVYENRTPKSPGVRFKLAEQVAGGRRQIGDRAHRARNRVTSSLGPRHVLREGSVIKMERMLVRMDLTVQQLPEYFDENESIRTESRQWEKWKEYMVVARRSNKSDNDDFRLQLYTTRVIPELDTEKTKKKPTREIRLLSRSTHVNLYSSLDKTVVLWHPYRKGTRIVIMKPCSAAHAVEWYTFLRDALGAHRTTVLQVHIPDLSVSLNIDRPFQALESPELEDVNEQTALMRAAEAEGAVAAKVIAQSLQMLEENPEWADVLKTWSQTTKMGLAWKRYDRLEWVYGIQERKMYGSMAMQHSHDLELRPKQHYPTYVHGKKSKIKEEPSPIEGFLVRLTSQKGLHRSWGKAYFKRLYFASYDQYLVFGRPAKVTPPHPPRLRTVTGSSIPSSDEIIENTPLMFNVEPYKIEEDNIEWLKDADDESFVKHDVAAREEAHRTLRNLESSDGFINMCQIRTIRKMKWGATEADEGLDSGSEVDFHEHISNTRHEDGETREVDDARTFELVLINDLVIRLQAYSTETRDTWMKRLKQLVRYWRLRTDADMNDLKGTRQLNLEHLQIDQDQEARIGQFARKWEVSQSDASPELYNMCRLTSCRTITFSGMLYRKPRRRGAFQRCSVILAGGQMLLFQAGLRRGTGEQIPHIHQDKQQVIDLKDCYVYSGLIVEDDLLYQNRTFDTAHAGMLAATPRVYLDDSWTTTDVDVMTCFVIWRNQKRAWFKSISADPLAKSSDKVKSRGDRRAKLRRVAQLGVSGSSMVFKCRSRAERDLWVTSISAEIQRAVERELYELGKGKTDDLADVRFEQ